MVQIWGKGDQGIAVMYSSLYISARAYEENASTCNNVTYWCNPGIVKIKETKIKKSMQTQWQL